MPWFYAGPEAKPVGPVSVEELHACRTRGTISPETYVIEQKGASASSEPMAWKRYKDVFPASADVTSLPPVPAPTLPPPPTPLPQPLPNPAAAQPHPLFPSAAPIPTTYPVYTATPSPGPHHVVHRTNGWCACGFWLGLASFLLLIACGFGILLAPFAFVLCLIGLAQVHAHREQGGQYQAIWGLILSVLAMLIGLILIFAIDMPFMKSHGLTVTEQTSNDSE